MFRVRESRDGTAEEQLRVFNEIVDDLVDIPGHDNHDTNKVRKSIKKFVIISV